MRVVWASLGVLVCSLALGCGASQAADDPNGGGQDASPSNGTSTESGQPTVGTLGTQPSAPSTTPSNPAGGITIVSDTPECRALLPAAIGAPREHDGSNPGVAFYAGTSDGDGQYVALEARERNGLENNSFVPTLGPDEVAGSLEAGVPLVGCGARPACPLDGSVIAPQPHGYHSLATIPNPFLTVSNGKGDVLRSVPVTSSDPSTGGFRIIADPRGGSAVLTREAGAELKRFDEAGNLIGSAAANADGGAVDAVAIATGGEALLIRGALARWYGRDARPLTDWFPLNDVVESAWALADGSVAIKSYSSRPVDRRWVAVVRPGSTSIEQPPVWLISERNPRIWVIRSGTAMALGSGFPYGDVPYGVPFGDCIACRTLRVVTRDGTVCGTVELPVAADDVNIGRDGTVLAAKAASASVIAWKWWPKLLQ